MVWLYIILITIFPQTNKENWYSYINRVGSKFKFKLLTLNATNSWIDACWTKHFYKTQWFR